MSNDTERKRDYAGYPPVYWIWLAVSAAFVLLFSLRPVILPGASVPATFGLLLLGLLDLRCLLWLAVPAEEGRAGRETAARQLLLYLAMTAVLALYLLSDFRMPQGITGDSMFCAALIALPGFPKNYSKRHK